MFVFVSQALVRDVDTVLSILCVRGSHRTGACGGVGRSGDRRSGTWGRRWGTAPKITWVGSGQLEATHTELQESWAGVRRALTQLPTTLPAHPRGDRPLGHKALLPQPTPAPGHTWKGILQSPSPVLEGRAPLPVTSPVPVCLQAADLQQVRKLQPTTTSCSPLRTWDQNIWEIGSERYYC